MRERTERKAEALEKRSWKKGILWKKKPEKEIREMEPFGKEKRRMEPGKQKAVEKETGE
jgi:hypothetical protein